jgi:hypothetical protein
VLEHQLLEIPHLLDTALKPFHLLRLLT